MRQRLQGTEEGKRLGTESKKEGSRVGSVEERQGNENRKARFAMDTKEPLPTPQDQFRSLSSILSQTQARLLAGLQARPAPLQSEIQSLVLSLFMSLSDSLWPLFFDSSVYPGRTMGNIKELMRKVEELESEKQALKEKYDERLGQLKKSRLKEGAGNLSMTQEYGGRTRTVGRKSGTTTRVPSLNSSTSSADLSHLRHSSSLRPRQFLPIRQQVLKAPRSISPANPTIHSLRTDLQRCRTMLEATQQERDTLKAWKEARIRKGEEGKGDEGEKKRLLTQVAIQQHRAKGLGIAVQRLVRVASTMQKTVRDKDLLVQFETSRAELEVLLREAISDSKSTLKTPPLRPQSELESRAAALEKDNARLERERAEGERKTGMLTEALNQAQRQLELLRSMSKPNLVEKHLPKELKRPTDSGLSLAQLEHLLKPFVLYISQRMHQINECLDKQEQALTRLSQAVRDRLQDQLKSLILVNDMLTQESDIAQIRAEKDNLERVLAATQDWARSRVKELEGLLDQTTTAGSVRLDSAVARARNDQIYSLESEVSSLNLYKETAVSSISGLEAALRDKEGEVRELKYELGRLEEREKEVRETERRKAEELVTVQAAFEQEMREAQRKIEELESRLAGKRETQQPIPIPIKSKPIPQPSTKKFLLDRPDSHTEKPLLSFLEQLNPPSFLELNLSLGAGKKEAESEETAGEYERKIEKMRGEMGILEDKVRELEDLLEGQRQMYHIEKDQLLSRYEQSEAALSASKLREQSIQQELASLHLSKPLPDLAATCARLQQEKEELKKALESLKSLLKKEAGAFGESPILNLSEEGKGSGKRLEGELDLGRLEDSPREASTPTSPPSSSLPSSPRLQSLSLIHSLLRPYIQPSEDLITTLSRLVDELQQLRKRKTGIVIPKLIMRHGVMHREIQTSPKGSEEKWSPESGNRGTSVQSTEQETPRHKAAPQVTSDQLYSLHSRLQSLEQEVLEAARGKELAEAEVRKVREEREEMVPGMGEMKDILFKVLSMLPKQ